MRLSYLGTLKTWLYAPLLAFFSPSAGAIRLPTLLLAATTVCIFSRTLQILHGSRAASIGGLLLATDSAFILTSTFDWGPVVLQHLLVCSGILAILRFHFTVKLRYLALASFCFGLALWDKALFVWLGAGLVVAAVVVFPHHLWRNATTRNLTVALLAFLTGALPLIVYNVRQHFSTFHSAQRFNFKDWDQKIFVLRSTWEGAGLFGYLVYQDDAPNPRMPLGRVESGAFWLRARTGVHQRNANTWALVGALALLPFLRNRRTVKLVLFCLIAITVAWLQMALTEGAGGAVHHVVLLWPLPHVILALVLAEVASRWGRVGTALCACAAACLLSANLLVLNQYLYQFARDGAQGSWTNAIYPLVDGLRSEKAPCFALVDWGILGPTDALTHGRLPLTWVDNSFLERPPARHPVLLGGENTVWVEHAEAYEQFPGIDGRVAAFAERNRLEPFCEHTYTDQNGRTIFKTFRLRPRP